MNNEPIRIKGRYVKDTKRGGHTWHTICDDNGMPIPFVPGVDDPMLLPEHCHPTRRVWYKDK